MAATDPRTLIADGIPHWLEPGAGFGWQVVAFEGHWAEPEFGADDEIEEVWTLCHHDGRTIYAVRRKVPVWPSGFAISPFWYCNHQPVACGPNSAPNNQPAGGGS